MANATKPNRSSLRWSDLGLLLVYGLCRVLPVAWVSAFGAWRGRYRGAKRVELEQRARQNLAEIAKDADPAVVIPMLHAASGRALLEVLIADRLAMSGRLAVKHHAALEGAIASNRSVVFALIHQANLGDVAGAAIGHAFPMVKQRFVITRHIQNPVMRWMVARTRHQSMQGMAGVVSGPMQGLARDMLRGLTQEAPSIALLHVDEARHHQIHFPGFGDDLPTKGINATHAIRLARRAGAVLVPVLLSRDKSCPTRFTLNVISVWDMATETRTNEAVCHEMSQMFEQAIVNDPAAWLNLYHRRPSAMRDMSHLSESEAFESKSNQ